MEGTRKKPYTASEFFDEFMKDIEVPDFIDYSCSTEKMTLLKFYEFEVYSKIMYGSSEGAYLDVIIEGKYDEEQPSPFTNLTIGVIKTLDSSDEAIYKLYQLAAEIFIKANRFVYDNLDDFTWLGYKVKINPEDNYHYEISTTERIVDRLYQLKKLGTDVSNVSIMDYSTRKMVDASEYLRLVEERFNEGGM